MATRDRRPRVALGVGAAVVLAIVLLLAPALYPIGPRPAGGAGSRSFGEARIVLAATRPSAISGLSWFNRTPSTGPTPGPIGGMVLAPDPPIGGVLLFGGSAGGSVSNATWQYNNSGWTRWTGTSPSPSARSGAEGTWDPAAGGVLVYGGLAPSGAPTLNDTWLFRNGSWTNLTPNVTGNPGPRGAGSLGIDPSSGAAVLVGGVNAPGTLTVNTWTFFHDTWTNVTLTAGAPPTGRVFPGAATDPALGGLLVYGGQDYTGPNLNDTWMYLNGSWTQLHPARSPGPLRGPFLSADTADDSVILFGGDTTQYGQPTAATWRFDANGSWTNVTPEVGGPPIPRWTGGMADDPSLAGVVLVGGCERIGCQYAANDTWVLESVPTLQATVQLATPIPAIGEPIEFTAGASGGVPPWKFQFEFGDGAVSPESSTANSSHIYRACGTFEATVTATDSGGTSATSGAVSVVLAGPVGTPNWCTLGASLTPPGRGSAVFVNDPAVGADLLFGGTQPTRLVENDTWLRTAAAWEPVTGPRPAPSPRGDASAWYDPGRRGVVLFGGQDSAGQFLNDTWLFNGSWWNITAVAGTPPSPRFEPSVAYDSTRGEAVLFGGLAPSGAALRDTWTFTSGRWSNTTSIAGTPPSARYWASGANDPGDGGIVLFGGRYCSGGPCGDTWLFNATGWHPTAGHGASPSPRRGSPFAYDSAYGADILFGGAVPSPGGGTEVPANDTWVFERGSWTNVTPLVGRAPPGRWASPLTGDSGLGGVAAFGGCTSANCVTSLGDLWSLGIPPLSANVQATLSGSTAPANASLAATASGGIGSLSYSWAFGDGTFENGSAAASVTHHYSAKGNFSGSVAVSDSGGVTRSATWSVSLVAPGSSNRSPGNGTNKTGPTPNGTTPITPHKASTGPPGWWTWAILGGLAALAAAVVGVARWKWRSGRRPSPPADAPASLPAYGSRGPGTGPSAARTEATPDLPGAPAGPTSPVVGGSIGLGAVAAVGPSDRNGSLSDRILVHLQRQGRLGPDELASTTVTQAGLSDALGRPQSAFARSLQRLESSGLVFTELRHVKGARRRLKVYRLTSLGEQRATELRTRPAGDAGPPAR